MNDLAVVGLEWLGGVTVFLGFILLLRYLEHRERMSMIERGLWQPETEQHPSYPRGSAQLRGGLITAGVGFALTIGLYNLGWLLPAPLAAAPGRIGPWLLPGLIPLAIGVALIVGHYLSPPSQVRQSREVGADNESKEKPQSNASPRSGWHVVHHEGTAGIEATQNDDGTDSTGIANLDNDADSTGTASSGA